MTPCLTFWCILSSAAIVAQRSSCSALCSVQLDKPISYASDIYLFLVDGSCFDGSGHSTCRTPMAGSSFLDPLEGKVLALIQAETRNSSICPKFKEQDLLKRLKAAWTLRGSLVQAMPTMYVLYDAVPELSLYRVISQTSLRQWGNVDDMQELANRLGGFYRLGIVSIDHTTGWAFR